MCFNFFCSSSTQEKNTFVKIDATHCQILDEHLKICLLIWTEEKKVFFVHRWKEFGYFNGRWNERMYIIFYIFMSSINMVVAMGSKWQNMFAKKIDSNTIKPVLSIQRTAFYVMHPVSTIRWIYKNPWKISWNYNQGLADVLMKKREEGRKKAYQ